MCAISVAGRGLFSPVAVLTTPAMRPSPPLYVYVAGKPTQTSIPIQWGKTTSRSLTPDLKVDSMTSDLNIATSDLKVHHDI